MLDITSRFVQVNTVLFSMNDTDKHCMHHMLDLLRRFQVARFDHSVIATFTPSFTGQSNNRLHGPF